MILRYDEIDEAEYHRHPALSVSIAKNLLKPGGPAKVNWDMKHGRAASRVFDLGHAAHKHARDEVTVLIALVLVLSVELAVVIAYAADGAGL